MIPVFVVFKINHIFVMFASGDKANRGEFQEFRQDEARDIVEIFRTLRATSDDDKWLFRVE